MKVTLIIPMYNESAIIEETAKTLSLYMEQTFEEYEILFSNDGSKDDCGERVERLQLPHVRVTGYAENHGKGCAVRTAVLESTGDFVMFTDADLAYGTEVIERAYRKWKETGAGMLIGSRNLDKEGYAGYTALRKLMSKLYIRVLCLAGGFRLSDSQCGCKAFSGDVARRIFSRCQVDGFAFDFEAILWAQKMGVSIVEMPVHIINHRESSVHVIRDTLRMLRDLRRIKKSVRRASL